MNQLEQEKKLVAEFMGWKLEDDGRMRAFIKENGKVLLYCNFNPQEDANAWPEIFKQIGKQPVVFRRNFMNHLRALIHMGGEHYQFEFEFNTLTTKTSILLQALIKTLEGK